ncbi:MAG: hypothetical protein EBR82_38660 [Caulobacteraceae bacterium]|nr:hypothetical protein [Caulobacteraceae bacterium]NDD03893.1 hypothetical protein [Pseudomonadota bacterium]NDG19279.1 hypothetical protein [Betaproteobacteria bacterium]
MKSILLALCFVAAVVSTAPAQNVTVVVNATAQQAAEHNARRGIVGHCARRAGRYEGIGFSTISSEHAIRSCCFWGRRPVREIGVARGARGWYAVVWYE